MKKTIATLTTGLFIALQIAGCGGGGGGSSASGVSSVGTAPANTLTVSRDDFGLQAPTLLYSTVAPQYVRLDAAVGSSVTDGWNLKPIVTIFVTSPDGVQGGRTYSIDGSGGAVFPGTVLFSDGRESVWRTAVSGTVTLTAWGKNKGDRIEGSFDVTMQDANPARVVKPTYRMAGSFRYYGGMETAVVPAPSPVPAAATALFASRCSGCHYLDGSTPAGGATTLSQKGYEAGEIFSGGAMHNGLALLPEELRNVQILLNAN